MPSQYRYEPRPTPKRTARGKHAARKAALRWSNAGTKASLVTFKELANAKKKKQKDEDILESARPSESPQRAKILRRLGEENVERTLGSRRFNKIQREIRTDPTKENYWKVKFGDGIYHVIYGPKVGIFGVMYYPPTSSKRKTRH